MQRSDTIAEISAALADFSADITNPPQTKTATVPTKAGGSYTYTYADLSDVLAHVRPALAKHGLAVAQDIAVDGSKVEVETTILHRTGEYLTFQPLALPAPEQHTPQQYGGVITYARRYSLMAALGLAAEADDDAAAASGRTAPAAAKGSHAAPAGGRKVTEKQLAKIHALAKEKGVTDDQLHRGAKRDHGVDSLKDLTTKQASDLIDSLSKLAAAAKGEQTGEVPADVDPAAEQARADQDEDDVPGMDGEAFRAKVKAEADAAGLDTSEVPF